MFINNSIVVVAQIQVSNLLHELLHGDLGAATNIQAVTRASKEVYSVRDCLDINGRSAPFNPIIFQNYVSSKSEHRYAMPSMESQPMVNGIGHVTIR